MKRPNKKMNRLIRECIEKNGDIRVIAERINAYCRRAGLPVHGYSQIAIMFETKYKDKYTEAVKKVK